MTLLPWIMAAAAPFIGSFLGVVALRLPRRRPLALSRSECDRCGHVLAAPDLVPIASYVWLGGRCRYCRAPIGGLLLLFECGALAMAIWAALVISGPVLVAGCVLGWSLLLLAVIDWREQFLPDVVTLPLLVAGLIVSYLLMSGSWPAHAIGAAVGFAGLALLALIYRILRGREGIGLGDAKLMAALGAWVSWEGLPTVLLWGSVLGLVVALAQAIRGGTLHLTDRVPFGTFLAAGGWLVWLYGPLLPVGSQ
jgi:leader peptidase (prepilin peptidase)/N-methyltransferase